MALVDVDAARVQAEVPAQRSHPAELRPGDLAAGVGERRQPRLHHFAARQLVDGAHRAEQQISLHLAQVAQLAGQPAQGDQVLRVVHAVLEVGNDVRPSRQDAGARMGAQRLHRLGDRRGTEHVQIGQRHHEAARSSRRPARSRNSLSMRWG